MKKFFAIIALFVSIMSVNAQTVDTLLYTDTIQFILTNDSVSNISGGQTDYYTLYCEGGAVSNPKMEFDLVGLTDGIHPNLKIGDYASSCYVIEQRIDSSMTYIFGDSIVRIDTIPLGHPGLYEFDTIYEIMDSIMEYDTINISHSIFKNGHNVIFLNDFFNIDSLTSIEIYISWSGEMDNHIVQFTDVYVTDENEPLGISSVQQSALKVYPNPTTSTVTVDSDEVEGMTVYNANGTIVAVSKTNRVDMSGLPVGMYFIRVGNRQAVKVMKY